MTAPRADNLRKAVFEVLDAALSCSVYWPKAPQADDGELLGPFPYVVIVQANESPWNTKTTRGTETVIQVDGYARATSGQSVEDAIFSLHSETKEALDRQALTVAGAHWVDTQFEGMSLGWEDGGKTRRCVSQYRIVLDQT